MYPKPDRGDLRLGQDVRERLVGEMCPPLGYICATPVQTFDLPRTLSFGSVSSLFVRFRPGEQNVHMAAAQLSPFRWCKSCGEGPLHSRPPSGEHLEILVFNLQYIMR